MSSPNTLNVPAFANSGPRCCPLCGSSTESSYRRIPRSYGAKRYELVLSRCHGCGFLFLENDPGISYDAEYMEREQVITEGNPYAAFQSQERICKIASFVVPGPGKAFLDIGIGDGLLLKLAEERGYETFGLDINEEGIKLARSTYGIRARLSLEALPHAFPGTGFDVIHMNEVIEHVPDPMELLRWCRKRLNKGGCLVVQTGNIDSLASRIKGDSWDYIRPVHLNYFSTSTLLFAIRECNFKPLRRVTCDWRIPRTFAFAADLLKRGGARKALSLVVLHLTAIPHGVRRTVVVYAT